MLSLRLLQSSTDLSEGVEERGGLRQRRRRHQRQRRRRREEHQGEDGQEGRHHEVRFAVLNCEKACLNRGNLGQGQVRACTIFLPWHISAMCEITGFITIFALSSLSYTLLTHGVTDVKKCKFVLASRGPD